MLTNPISIVPVQTNTCKNGVRNMSFRWVCKSAPE